MRYLVLGSEGVVGTSFCKYIFDHCKSDKVIRWDIKLGDEFDLRNTNNNTKLKQAMDECDFVMFFACDVGGSKYLTTVNDVEFINNNLMIMINVFTLINKCNKPFIFTSSQMSNMHHCSYGTCKKIGEHYSQSLDGIVVQLWNTYGCEQVNEKSHVITDFVDMALKNKCIVMRTDGTEKRQFLYDEDCAKAMHVLSNNYSTYKHKIVHLTNGNWVTILDVAKLIQLQIPGTIIIPGKKKDNTQIMVNEPSQFIDEMHWKPCISLTKGINLIIGQLSS